MTTEIYSVHIALSLGLFLALSWIGRHSVSSGYISLSAFLQNDGAPAFNLLFRILGPIVFIILAASFFYSVGLDRYVANIWLVILYYYAGRLLYILVFGRHQLVNWWREALLWAASIGLGWLLYDQIIQVRENLLPDVKDLKNQFWILLILFLYSAFNNIRLGQEGTKKRKENYLKNSYTRCKALYGKIISSLATDTLSESLIYSVLLYEQFNRPAMIQMAERMVFPWCSRSLGPMQVKTNKRITDAESVRLGAEHIIEAYRGALEEGAQKAKINKIDFNPLSNNMHLHFVLYKVASGYNKDDDYMFGIQEMHSQIVELLYPELQFVSKHWSKYLV